MILAIELSQTDDVDNDGNLCGQQIYTSKIAVFEYEFSAMEFAKDKAHILLVDCGAGEILKDANVKVGEE